MTIGPRKEVEAIHLKAMPAILTTGEEIEVWMTAPGQEALKLQRPLTDGALRTVARGEKKDRERKLVTEGGCDDLGEDVLASGAIDKCDL